ncbi:hypothetical protein HDU93_002873, partial [Gonapodya sp. JEL0774]
MEVDPVIAEVTGVVVIPDMPEVCVWVEVMNSLIEVVAVVEAAVVELAKVVVSLPTEVVSKLVVDNGAEEVRVAVVDVAIEVLETWVEEVVTDVGKV